MCAPADYPVRGIQGSPGYDINAFFRRSSYLRDFVTTARRHGMLLGESSVPVAAYIRGVDLSEAATQQARPLGIFGIGRLRTYGVP